MTSQYLRSRFSALREYLTPINHTSTFAETGEITPEEFVKAGDYLVYRFPTWQWSPADKSKCKEFLPPDKQYLVTRHVPSCVRASDYELTDDDIMQNDGQQEEEPHNGESDPNPGAKESDGSSGNGQDNDNTAGNVDDEESWTTTHKLTKTKSNVNKMISDRSEHGDADDIDESSVKEISEDDESDIQDIDDLIDEDAEDMEFVDTKTADRGCNKKRYYDLYITYSTSYRVPKMYLVGFDSNSVPLTPEQMFEDIASDYRHKTVTIEKAPFLKNTTAVSIHPCRHAAVMKVLMKRAAAAALERSKNSDSDRLVEKVSKLGLKENIENKSSDVHGAEHPDDWEDVQGEPDSGIRVDQYLIVFLKFISSVTPGIEHDYTMEAL